MVLKWSVEYCDTWLYFQLSIISFKCAISGLLWYERMRTRAASNSRGLVSRMTFMLSWVCLCLVWSVLYLDVCSLPYWCGGSVACVLSASIWIHVSFLPYYGFVSMSSPWLVTSNQLPRISYRSRSLDNTHWGSCPSIRPFSSLSDYEPIF